MGKQTKAVVLFCSVLVGVCDIDSFLFSKIPPPLQSPSLYEIYMYNYISLKNSLLQVSFFLGRSVKMMFLLCV